MIVPGTFIFPDERCRDLASRRGLVLNMHHILVVGLNTYRWPDKVPFSYTRHRIYYHTAMLNGGANQLSEMVPPSRIHRARGRFYPQKGP